MTWSSRSIERARPVDSSTSITTLLNWTGPPATSKRRGMPSRKRATMMSLSTPSTESRGPTMPVSDTCAVPCGRTLGSAVGTCVCEPTTAEDRPYREREELDVVEELPLIPDVVPVRDDVRAVRVELARDVGGQSRAARGVLAVHDREVDLALRADLRQECRYRVPTWSPDDIPDKKDSHGLTRRRALTRTTRKRVEVRVSGCATEGARARGGPIPEGCGSARR